MSKFKVGDRVRIVRSGNDSKYWCDHEVGSVHTVEMVYESGDYEVDFQTMHPNDIEPITHTHTLTPGKIYTMASGRKCKIIYVEDGFAYGFHLHDNGAHGKTAYCWDMSGEYQNALECDRVDYRIVFEPVRETVYTYHSIWNGDKFKYKVSVDMVDGTPDWSTATVTPCD